MFVETMTAVDRDLRRDRVSGPKLVGLLLAILSVVVVTGWPWSERSDPATWLPANRPSSVIIHQGRSVVDLYLSPDVAVKLLVSNLGHSSQSSLMTVKAEPLSGPPQYRPVSLDLDLFDPQVTTRREGAAPVEPIGLPTGFGLYGSAGASPSQSPGPDIDSERSLTTERLIAEVPPPQASRDFWLHVTAEPLEDSRGYQLIHGWLAVTRQTIQVYIDSSLHGADGCPPTVQKLAQEIAERLESSVLPAIGSRLGKVTDVDGDGRLTVLITPWLSRLRGGETQVRGFVRSSDFRDDIASPFSNHADVLYLNSDLPSGTGLQTLLLHEVTHAALFSKGVERKVVDRSAIQRPDRGAIHDHTPRFQPKLSKHLEWEDWLNEGLAHLSERSGGGDWSNLDYRVARFWQQPANAPLIVSDYYRSGRWRDHGCRGATFLFLEWCEQQYPNRDRSAFTTAVATAGRPGVEAIEIVLGRDFDDLYRAWTVSVATQQAAAVNPARIGRFGASGPHWLEWNMTRSSQHTLDIAGTATQFVELRASRPRWYRLSLEGDRHQPWQVTLINSSLSRPVFELCAHWDEDASTNPSDLVLSMSSPLPKDWQIDRVTCEEIREPHPRVWDWSANDISHAAAATARLPQRVVVLPLGNLGLDSESAVIKVRMKKSTGEIAWAWCDLPQWPPQPTRMAAHGLD